MKDSQQMSVDISSQNDMALQALPPVSLKESNIFRVDSEDLPSESCYDFNLSDIEDVEKTERKESTVEVSQESEDEILNKFVTNESDETVKVGGADADEKMEEELLNDCVEAKETEAINDDSVNDADNSKSDIKKSEDASLSETCANGEVPEKDSVEEEKEPVAAAADTTEEEEKKEDAEMKEKEDAEMKEKEDAEMKEKEDAEMKEKEDAEMKEKVNAELLEDQIMDTEHLLQIVDQQDTGEPNENSCSGETTPDKEESDGAETETEKNDDDEDNQASKMDDESVDIDEGSPYKGDFDSELDKEYDKIVNEKEGEEVVEGTEDKVEEETSVAEKMDEDSVENDAVVQEDKAATDDDEKDGSQMATEVSETTAKDEEPERTTETTETEAESDKHELPDTTVKTKRTLSESETMVEAKRLRLEEGDIAAEDTNDSKDSEAFVKPLEPVIALNAISDYMQKKSLKRLTREDLEQICLMKMCEAICHKSEIGELRHQLSIQEQMIDMWRKEAAQLTKQARDLEIVNKRLLHEVRLKNDKDKPLIPVKITRSVGLQVRSDNNVMYNALAQKRRFARPQQPVSAGAPSKQSQPQQQQQGRFNQTKAVASPSGKTPISKPVQASPANKLTPSMKPKPLTPKTPNSLLSKALQNSTAQAANSPSANAAATNSTATPSSPSATNAPATPTTPVVAKSISTVSPKTVKPTESKGVIDLTDEDEKKPSSPTTGTTTVSAAQGVRIVSAPVKNANAASSPGVVNPPRIMYLYNNQLHQGVLATDASKVGSQKVMFKLNSNVIGQANGVLTTVTTGQPIAVSNGAVRTSQVQSVRFSSPVTTVRTSASSKATAAKHPAPLPPPPLTQINLAARKPIPPKPHLSIRRSSGGIVLSWKMPYNLDNYEAIASYQLYAYQETTSAPSSDMWRKVGDVKALALPMACTLTQFADGNKYHFAVRAVDVQKRMGPFSDPEQILL